MVHVLFLPAFLLLAAPALLPAALASDAVPLLLVSRSVT
tara:strand:+ start:151 stop:267 length:117 start_codon:yes stop_codon:yes gene_type:complete